ncbi:dysbindin protein homolog [Cloeon dipterum]|uniref:dysbindin protein homolog n=1 Tax=Cloeon dipterum TaxID=197152 RepID=UPI0032207B56
MFGSLRDKLQNVQEGISASFRILSVSDSSPRKPKSPSTQKVNFNAGAELLDKYQTDWKEIHDAAEDNARKADLVDQMIDSLHQNVKKQWTDIGNLSSSVNEVPHLIYKVQELIEEINTLKNTCEEVQHSLLELEDLVETQVLREEQLDHRFQLAMYKEKKLAEFEEFRKNLEKEHSEKLRKYEEHQTSILHERQEAFGKVFSEEMDEFKKSGHIPKLEIRGHFDKEISLEEVDLEADKSALDEFLQDVDNDSDSNIDFQIEADSTK